MRKKSNLEAKGDNERTSVVNVGHIGNVGVMSNLKKAVDLGSKDKNQMRRRKRMNAGVLLGYGQAVLPL